MRRLSLGQRSLVSALSHRYRCSSPSFPTLRPGRTSWWRRHRPEIPRGWSSKPRAAPGCRGPPSGTPGIQGPYKFWERRKLYPYIPPNILRDLAMSRVNILQFWASYSRWSKHSSRPSNVSSKFCNFFASILLWRTSFSLQEVWKFWGSKIGKCSVGPV